MTDEVERLIERQVRAWPLLAKGIEGLARARTRSVKVDWYEVAVRHIPHRIASTTAEVDSASIAKRPCFLCAEHLPPEEEGLPFGNEFVIYCNPLPIVNSHLTIAHRAHTPQRIAQQFGNMLELAAALPGYFVIYNGPQCGASAPDHMHFQAGARDLFPIEKDTARSAGVTIPNYGRNVFMFRERDQATVIAKVNLALELLAQVSDGRVEPMVNIAAFYDDSHWVAYLFPRGKHRPEVYYTGEFVISPAAIDLCGILVAPRAKDFETITAETIATVFREITLPEETFCEVADRLESAP